MTLNSVFSLGADALKSLFVVRFMDPTFAPFVNNGLSQDELMFRLTTFSVPEGGVEPQEVHFLTQKLTRPGGQIDEPKQITLPFRIDKGFRMLQALYDWRDMAANTYTGVIGDLIGTGMTTSLSVFPISSQSLDPGQSSFLSLPGVGSWDFEYAWCSKIGNIDLTMEDNGFVTGEATVNFLRMRHNVGRSSPNTIIDPNAYV